ncbi:MAG: 3'-5' exonuclease [bacterium]|jgi:DNA polymerase III epsilon subunit family exonuclease
MLAMSFQLVAETVYADPNAWLDQPLTNATFVVFDVETTGLLARQSRILEIGAIKFRNGEILERRNWLIKPDIPIPWEVQGIHGITPALVSNAPPFSSVFPEFSAFASNTILLAHNARFDHAFIAEELIRNQLSFPATPILDTIPLCKVWHPEQRSFSLQNLTASLTPNHEEHTITDTSLPDGTLRNNRFHSALYDCEFLTLLVMKGFQKLPQDATVKALTHITGGVYFFEHHRLKKLPRETPTCKP